VIAVVVSLGQAALAATVAVLHLLAAAALIAARGIRRRPGGISTA
jgi:hypothetical protein